MGKHERRTCLEAIRGRYLKADRAGKARMLDKFCAVCGYHGKYAIPLLGRKKPGSTPRRVGRKPRYDRAQSGMNLAKPAISRFPGEVGQWQSTWRVKLLMLQAIRFEAFYAFRRGVPRWGAGMDLRRVVRQLTQQ
jgi:hypothetical protein